MAELLFVAMFDYLSQRIGSPERHGEIERVDLGKHGGPTVTATEWSCCHLTSGIAIGL